MKIGKLALIGALAFSSFTAIEMIKPTTQVAALYEEPYSPTDKDSWGITNIKQLPLVGTQTLDAKESYKTGDDFFYTQSTVKTGDRALIKIFKVHSDGSLHRYITFGSDYGEPHKIDPFWFNVFTDVYTSGKYVAILRDGSEIKYSKQFQIN
ncbi:DUF5065 family protein [Bacillus mycoides]|uniref:DUF5065 family protein n=1 Tax=Bacillus mycoides TaxID=1405 RepID=UPI001C02FB63|nr:DUF5065 family protein [Bacillus mycoides]QWG92771.1 DUF5065 family protein [Bacillus mycoides]